MEVNKYSLPAALAGHIPQLRARPGELPWQVKVAAAPLLSLGTALHPGEGISSLTTHTGTENHQARSEITLGDLAKWSCCWSDQKGNFSGSPLVIQHVNMHMC